MSTKPAADHHRTTLERLLAEQPPRRLRCFDTDQAWREFLILSRDGGDRVTRRSDTGKWAGTRKVIPVFADGLRRLPCSDCPAAYRHKMEATGRCEQVPAIKSARRWLKTLLADGPMASADIKGRAIAAGFAWRTVKLAKQRDGIESQAVAFGTRVVVWFIERARFEAERARFVKPTDQAAHKEPSS